MYLCLQFLFCTSQFLFSPSAQALRVLGMNSGLDSGCVCTRRVRVAPLVAVVLPSVLEASVARCVLCCVRGVLVRCMCSAQMRVLTVLTSTCLIPLVVLVWMS